MPADPPMFCGDCWRMAFGTFLSTLAAGLGTWAATALLTWLAR
jgi:hypothetical protein